MDDWRKIFYGKLLAYQIQPSVATGDPPPSDFLGFASGKITDENKALLLPGISLLLTYSVILRSLINGRTIINIKEVKTVKDLLEVDLSKNELLITPTNDTLEGIIEAYDPELLSSDKIPELYISETIKPGISYGLTYEELNGLIEGNYLRNILINITVNF